MDLTQTQMEQFFADGTLPEGAVPAPAPVPAEPVVEAPAQAPAPVATEAPAPAPAPVNNSAEEYLQQLLVQERQRTGEMAEVLKGLQKQVDSLKTPEVPDAEKDPFGHMMHAINELNAKINQIQNGTAEQVSAAQQREQLQQFAQALDNQVKTFEKDHTDYQSALKHLRDSRIQDFKDAGYTSQEAQQLLNQEELNIAIRAMQAGKNPAQIAYQISQRYGYKPSATAESPDSKVDRIKEGLKATEAVKPGTPKTGEISYKNLDGVSDEDLTKAVESNWETMMGAPSHKSIF